MDDLLIFGLDDNKIKKLQDALNSQFKMTDLGDISHYLGIQVDLDVGKKITLNQGTYIRKVLERFGMLDCRPAAIPMDPGVPNSILPYDGKADYDTIVWYQSAVGSLMWPAVLTRPDISLAVGVISRYCGNPGPAHIKLVIQVFRYLAGSLDVGITYSADSPDHLIGYTDSDWAGAVDGRRSTGAYVFMLAGGPISHQSKQQPVVALSSCEAEYMAVTEAGKEAIWCTRFLKALGHETEGPADLRADNKSAIALSENPEFHRRVKHIEIRYHWIREKVTSKDIMLTFVSTDVMTADGLTKPLAPLKFREFRTMLGMTHITTKDRS